jgi:hypothetical protein
VEQSDMRIDARNDLAVELQHETKNAVGRWVLRPEIDGEIADSGFGHSGLASAAGATLPRACWFQTLLTSMREHEVSDDLALRIMRLVIKASRVRGACYSLDSAEEPTQFE